MRDQLHPYPPPPYPYPSTIKPPSSHEEACDVFTWAHITLCRACAYVKTFLIYRAPQQGGFKPAIIHAIAAMALKFLPLKPSLITPSSPSSTQGGTLKASINSTTTSPPIHASDTRGAIKEPPISVSMQKTDSTKLPSHHCQYQYMKGIK